MVKKIRVIDEPIEETTEDVSMETFYELAKTMDWKLWEILQIMQRFEKKIQVLDNQDVDNEVVKKSSK
jgi:hypothetical protein